MASMEYNEKYHREVHDYLISDSEYYALRSKIAFRKYFSYVKDLRSKKMLEFGCGLGQNIFALRNLSCYGYDIAKFSLDFCEKKGIKVFRLFNQIPSMDLIFSSHVLEHLDNPLETLKSFNKKLSKEGILILVIPRESHERANLEPDLRNYHLYSWNFQTINNLLHKSGFKVVKNQISYGAAYHKLKFLSKISFGLYFLATRIIGRLFNRSELVIIARKT
jgi:SAM-dependent methyltransferase